MDPQLSDILKNGKLPTRKDLNTKRGNDIIIFRLNVQGGIDNKQHTKTIFGHKDFLDKYHYWCEDFSDYSYIDGKTNRSMNGWRLVLKHEGEEGKERLGRIIKNTYRVLMSRGMKGCYIYCTDPETREYFKMMMK